jgi:hypothetical protein
MMIENVSQRLARANQEKMRLKRLYYIISCSSHNPVANAAYKSLNMEEEHSDIQLEITPWEESLPDWAMTTLVNLEEVDQSVLLVSLTLTSGEQERLTTEAAKDPFNHLRL